MSVTMKVTMDSAGRLVIPKPIRDEVGLQPGLPLEIRADAGCIEVKPATAAVKIVRKGRLTVAVSEEEIEPMKEEVVLAVLDELRAHRGDL